MYKRFVCVSYPDYDIVFSNEVVKGSGFSDNTSKIEETGFVKFGDESFPCVDVSDYIGMFVNNTEKGNIWAYVLLDKNEFPQLYGKFSDESQFFALGTKSGRFSISDVSLAEFMVLPGKIGKNMQQRGVTAFRFTKENKFQYLVDLELFIKNIMEEKND